MKLLIALAVFVVLAYADDDFPTAISQGDLAVDEHRLIGYGSLYGRSHYGHRFGHYGRYPQRSSYYRYDHAGRGRRSTEAADQNAQEHRYGGYRGHFGYGGYYRPSGRYYDRPYYG